MYSLNLEKNKDGFMTLLFGGYEEKYYEETHWLSSSINLGPWNTYIWSLNISNPSIERVIKKNIMTLFMSEYAITVPKDIYEQL